jgi:hypothetical protein
LVNDQRVYFGELSLNTGSYFIYHRAIITGLSTNLFVARPDYKVPLSLLSRSGIFTQTSSCVSSINHVFSAPLFAQHSSAYALPRFGGFHTASRLTGRKYTCMQ